jgi:hypothetical protein
MGNGRYFCSFQKYANPEVHLVNVYDKEKGIVLYACEHFPRFLLERINGRIILEPSTTMEEAFGSGGPEMATVAIEISKERRREVEHERKKLSL